MGCATNLCGVARLRLLLHSTPAAEGDRLFRLEPVEVRRGAGLDRVLSRDGELTVFGQHLQHRTFQPDPTYLTPQCAVKVDRGSAPLIASTPLQSRVSAEGVAKRGEPLQVQPTGQTLSRIAVEPL